MSLTTQPGFETDQPIPPERVQFRSLLLANPNHFGNVANSNLKAILPKAGDVAYEELKCVGYNPDLNQLKAAVWIKQSSGFLGELCSAGSIEYIRFFMSFDGGASWQDQGLTSFQTFDIPGTKPLEYAATLTPPAHRTWCTREMLPRLRAILSWNLPPPAGMPNFVPVWGNVLEAHIQIRPLRFFTVSDLLAEAQLKLPDALQALIDPAQQISALPPAALGVSQLAVLYKPEEVPAHRVLFAHAYAHIARPEASEAFAAFGSPGPFAGLNLAANVAGNVAGNVGADIFAIVGGEGKGDTSFEQLDCIGLDPNGTENLVGTLTIKRPVGYSGGPCTAGSQEYVAFWVDWQDGGGFHWVGTAQVGVHDFHSIPPDGLRYAVAQPVNLSPHRKPCGEGPVTARVRAILSWAVPPAPSNPNATPHWGNRQDTLVLIPPGQRAVTGDYTPYIESICSVDACTIDPTTGFAPGDRPFGGTVSIFGIIPGAPSVTTPLANRPKYRVTVQPVLGGAPQHVTDPFGITLHQQVLPGLPQDIPFSQTVDGDDYFTYQVAPNVPGVGWRDVVPSGLLAQWNTAGKTGRWRISIEAKDPVTNTAYPAGGTVCPDGTVRSAVIIDLDNAAPLTGLHITGVSHGGGPVTPAVDCASFQVGDVIHGTYFVADEHFGSLALVVEPSVHANGASVDVGGGVNSRSYPTVPTTGESGTWTLNTHGMDPCGYTIQLQSNDRTIVDCDGPWRNDNAFVGFCLVK